MKRLGTRAKRFAAGMLRRFSIRRFALTLSLATLSMIVISLVQAHPAWAANALDCAPTNLGFNNVANTFCTATGDWLTRAQNLARGFFFSLVGVEMAWSLILYALQKDNLGELLTSWLIKIMGICFFYAVILNANVWLPQILKSFVLLGNQVTASNIALDPEGIFEIGLGFCNLIFQQLPQANFPGWEAGPTVFNPNISGTIVDNLTVAFEMFVCVVFAGIICLIIFASYIVVAGQLLMTMIEAYIMISAGAVMLGFMGSRWTMSWGERYIGYAMSIGIKLFVTFVILGLGTALTTAWGGMLATIHSYVFDGPNTINNLSTIVQDYLSIGAAAIIYMMLVVKLPGLASSMMNGSPSMSFGGAASTAGAVAGAVTGIAAGIVSAAGGALSKADKAMSALKDASAVDDKVGALAKQGAAEALGDAADSAAGASSGKSLDDPTGSLGSAVGAALEGDDSEGGDLMSEIDDGGLGDAPDGAQGGTDGSGSPNGVLDQATLEERDAMAENGELLSGESSEMDSLSTVALGDDDIANMADFDSSSSSGSGAASSADGSGGKDAQLTQAIQEARASSRKAEQSGLEREYAHAASSARDHSLGAIGSLAQGTINSASSGAGLVTHLDEGGTLGAAQVSLKMPD